MFFVFFHLTFLHWTTSTTISTTISEVLVLYVSIRLQVTPRRLVPTNMHVSFNLFNLTLYRNKKEMRWKKKIERLLSPGTFGGSSLDSILLRTTLIRMVSCQKVAIVPQITFLSKL